MYDSEVLSHQKTPAKFNVNCSFTSHIQRAGTKFCWISKLSLWDQTLLSFPRQVPMAFSSSSCPIPKTSN